MLIFNDNPTRNMFAGTNVRAYGANEHEYHVNETELDGQEAPGYYVEVYYRDGEYLGSSRHAFTTLHAAKVWCDRHNDDFQLV